MAQVRRFPAQVQTARLVGDRITRADSEALVAIVADPEIPEAMYPAALRGPGRTRAGIDRMVRHWDERGFGPWVARERATGAVVGRVGLLSAVVEGREAVEVGWFVSRARWGLGYATELAAVAVQHAFASLRLPELVSFTLPANAPSQAVMRKLGFTPAGEIEHAGLPHVLFRLAAPAD